jgi:hypothetical protein
MNRENIYAALFAAVSGAPGLVTASRRLRHWSDVSSSDLPALFLAQGKQVVGPPAAIGLPTRWMLEATIYLYVGTQGAASAGTVLNPIVDAITAMFDPNGASVVQTLGKRVEWARIEGAIETSEGMLGDVEVCMIPVRMLAV